jgi:hypothetical protein
VQGEEVFASRIRGGYVCLPSFKNLNSILREVASKLNLLKRRGELSFFQGISLKGLLCIVAYEELTSWVLFALPLH